MIQSTFDCISSLMTNVVLLPACVMAAVPNSKVNSSVFGFMLQRYEKTVKGQRKRKEKITWCLLPGNLLAVLNIYSAFLWCCYLVA